MADRMTLDHWRRVNPGRPIVGAESTNDLLRNPEVQRQIAARIKTLKYLALLPVGILGAGLWSAGRQRSKAEEPRAIDFAVEPHQPAVLSIDPSSPDGYTPISSLCSSVGNGLDRSMDDSESARLVAEQIVAELAGRAGGAD